MDRFEPSRQPDDEPQHKSRARSLLTKRVTWFAAAWVAVAIAAIGSIVYITTSGGNGSDDSNTGQQGETSGEEGGIASALKDQGLLNDQDASASVDPNSVKGALTQGASGHAGGAHDHGKHPTYTEMMSMSDDQLIGLFPANTLTKGDLPGLREQLTEVRAVAERLNTVEAAQAAGYVQTTNDVPFMGEHWLNFKFVRDGKFNPSEPEGLLFSTIDGQRKLVGVWFLQLPGVCPAGQTGCPTRDVEPVGFQGDLDLWHAHLGLCIVQLKGASEGETRESCEAKGGSYTADLRWMMHVWVTPEATENADGFFAYLNNDLYSKQLASQASNTSPSGTTP